MRNSLQRLSQQLYLVEQKPGVELVCRYASLHFFLAENCEFETPPEHENHIELTYHHENK